MSPLYCQNLTHVYGRGDMAETALADVSLEFEAGETCVLMGPSGSGKTTLLSILGCLLTPTRGELYVCGEAVHAAPRHKLTALRRKAIGFVFQHAQLLPFLSLEDNLLVIGDNVGLSRHELKDRIDRLLERLDIGRLRRRRPHEVSGGQRQRFAVARALLHGPKIVLADEPTAALDWRHGEEAVKLLIEEARSAGALLITVTHDARLARLFERELHIENGRIVAGNLVKES
ncbi:MAG TPA: ABC transporter ATP-binding protein [Pirellulales bacterium]|nr:ABC transporter ATP-binding protein [Pirellulales bacterium]